MPKKKQQITKTIGNNELYYSDDELEISHDTDNPDPYADRYHMVRFTKQQLPELIEFLDSLIQTLV